MEKRISALISILILAAVIPAFLFFSGGFDKITGQAVSEGPPENAGEVHTVGPSQEEQNCMMKCVSDAGCTVGDASCPAKDKCMTQCNVVKPETTEETSCMEKCVLVGCTERDFNCQTKNQAKCEEECDMIKAPDESEMSAEQLCITNCVALVDPKIRCGASQTGETGGEVCQKCAADCVHLYAGPCLDDAKLKAKQKECETCEHCYGEPVMGDSGEGWDCIIDVECKDASGEFGDNPGIGPGIQKIGEAIGNAFEKVGEFFSNLFCGGESSGEESASASGGGSEGSESSEPSSSSGGEAPAAPETSG